MISILVFSKRLIYDKFQIRFGQIPTYLKKLIKCTGK